jgi:hypothetical protein
MANIVLEDRREPPRSEPENAPFKCPPWVESGHPGGAKIKEKRTIIEADKKLAERVVVVNSGLQNKPIVAVRRCPRAKYKLSMFLRRLRIPVGLYSRLNRVFL